MDAHAHLARAAEALACHKAMLATLDPDDPSHVARAAAGDRALALRDLDEAVAAIDAALALR